MGYLTYSEREALQQTQEYLNLSSDIRHKFELQYPKRKVTQRHMLNSGISLSEVTKRAKEFAETWQVDVENISLDCEIESEYGSDYARLSLTLETLESDQQYHKRLAEVYKWNLEQEKRDRKEFERLAAKFK